MHRQSCDDYLRLQVLYTMPSQDSSDPDAATISESGAMNVFFLIDKVRERSLQKCRMSGVIILM